MFGITTGQIASGIIAGILTKYGIDAMENTRKNVVPDTDLSMDEKQLVLLCAILEALKPDQEASVHRAFPLLPYPLEYPIQDDWFNKAHMCIFFHDQTPIRFDIDGIGTYNKTVGPGWIQCDVRGRLSTTDGLNHNVIVSYRDDALGAAL